MASPQCEHGFTRIANELLDAALELLPPEEFHLWAAIVRQTYGFGRKRVDLSAEALAQACGVNVRAVRSRLAALVARGALYAQRNGPKPATLTIEKDYELWQKDMQPTARIAKRRAVHDTSFEETGKAKEKKDVTADEKDVQRTTRLSKRRAAHDTSSGPYQLEKERKIYMGSTDDFLRVSTAYHERIRETHPALAHALKPASDRAGALALSRLVKIDGCDWETVKEVLRWVLKDEFWSRQLISLASLRSKSSRNGLTKFANAMTAWDLSRARPAGMAHVIEQAACRPAAPGEALTVRLFPEEDTGPAEAV